MAAFNVNIPYQYYPDPTRGRPVFNGFIYVGVADQDPETNPIPVVVIDEDGIETPIAQPIRTNAGGLPVYNGSVAQIAVDANYSLRVRDKDGAEVYYVPDAVAAGTANNTQFIPLAGTQAAQPISGRLEYNSGTDSWFVDQGNLFGLNSMVFRGDANDSAFYVVTKDGVGVENTFNFTPDGQFTIPSKGSSTDAWVFQGADFLGNPNALGIYSVDQGTGLRTSSPILLYTSETQAFAFDTAGKITTSGVVTDADAPQVLVTKAYLSEEISDITGLLPSSSVGSVAIGGSTDWGVADHFTIDETGIPGLAVVSLFGSFFIENTDPIHAGKNWFFLADDFSGSNNLNIGSNSGTSNSLTIWAAGQGNAGGAFILTDTGFLSLPQDATNDVHAVRKGQMDTELAGIRERQLVASARVNWAGSTPVLQPGSVGVASVANQGTGFMDVVLTDPITDFNTHMIPQATSITGGLVLGCLPISTTTIRVTSFNWATSASQAGDYFITVWDNS